MTHEEIANLLRLISKAVSESSPWKDKRAAIINEASINQETDLEEFAAWFIPETTEESAP